MTLPEWRTCFKMRSNEEFQKERFINNFLIRQETMQRDGSCKSSSKSISASHSLYTRLKARIFKAAALL